MDTNELKIKPEEVDRPSKLLLLALQDLRKVVQEGTKIDMDTVWYERNMTNPDICTVCFAGAIFKAHFEDEVLLEQSKNHLYVQMVNINSEVRVGKYSLKDAMWALNYFRQGLVSEALKCLGLSGASWEFRVTRYSTDQANFYADIQEIANYLISKGL